MRTYVRIWVKSSLPVGCLADLVSDAHRSAGHDPGVDAAQVELLAGVRVDELQRIDAEPPCELAAASMPLVGHLDYGAPQLETRAGGQVVAAQVQVDVQLVPGTRPPLPVACQQRRHSRVHERDLPVGVGGAVLPGAASTDAPAIPDQALDWIELRPIEQLALLHGGAAHYQLHPAGFLRRAPDPRQPLL